MITSPPALQLYTVREQLPTDRMAVLRRIAGFGYGAVEPYDVLTDPDRLRADLDEAGLTVCSVHAKVLGPDADALLRGTRTVGAATVIVPWMEPAIFADADGVARLARDLNEAAVRAADHGLRLGYHNHWFELEHRFDGRTALELLAAQLPPEVVLEVDTYWAAVGGEDPAALLSRLGSKVAALHLKDGPISRDTKAMQPVGEGAMRFPAIIAAAPSALRVVEADDSRMDQFDLLARSRDYLVREGLA